MKIWKKNMVAAAVLVTVCAGIYVNWLYMEDNTAASLVDTLDAQKVMSDDTLILSEDMAAIAAGEDVQTTATDYFAAVRLSRQQARDSAVNLLQDAGLLESIAESTYQYYLSQNMETSYTKSLPKAFN